MLFYYKKCNIAGHICKQEGRKVVSKLVHKLIETPNVVEPLWELVVVLRGT